MNKIVDSPKPIVYSTNSKHMTTAFTNKKVSLFTAPVAKKKVSAVAKINAKSGTAKASAAVKAQPAFVAAGLKKQAECLSGNGAKKFSTTGSPFVDQFGKVATYKKPRSYNEIAKDCETLWAEDELLATKFAFYLRTITRKVKLMDGTETENSQKGGELKHEAQMRLIWLSQKSPKTFWANFPLFISLGSWHDVFTLLSYDLVFNGWEGRKLDWKQFGDLILSGLSNENTSNLVKKFLPQIKAKSACKTVESQANTIIAKWICSLLFGSKVDAEAASTYKQYRKLKTTGTAHEWQKLISNKQFTKIDFNKIHGRALSLLVHSKFLKNQGLSDKYEKWVTKPETKVKYTGFVHELFAQLPAHRTNDAVIETTNNKQFATLVEKGQPEEGTSAAQLIVVRDTSGSMQSNATGTNISSFNIAKAIALYFSEFLTGKFADSFIEFNSDAKMHVWKGKTPVDKWYNDHSSVLGSTDFQSVIRLFAQLKRSGVTESEFPKGILCISDGEFNPAQLGKTNVDAARSTLRQAGFSEQYVRDFKIILWNIPNAYYTHIPEVKFETNGNVDNVFYFSGYSSSVISFLTGEAILTAADVFDNAMNQEILNMIEV